jgi:large subunit ribosomal protein L29
MKASEIREMSAEERAQKLRETTEALFNLRFQHEVGQLENPQRIKQTRRDIARIQTVLRESKANL